MSIFRFSFGCRRGVLFISVLIAAWPLVAQTYTASPISSDSYGTYPYSFTGILTAPERSSSLIDFGSGAVVRNPRVVYSCAHVVFDADTLDPWLNGVRWYLRWASGSQPSSFVGQPLRSYYYFVGYASAARVQLNSVESFSMDFVVHYAYESTANGGYAGYYDDGVTSLLSSRTKLITGYPNGNYASGDSRKFLMHSTGPFNRPFVVRTGDYLGISEVSTGSGNSGGPVWVYDGSQYGFAGVLVSGLERSRGNSTDFAGIYGVDSTSAALIDAAIGSSSGAVAAPLITAQPTSRRVGVGQSATFAVTATGSSISYRWLFNGVAMASATNATLALNNVSLADVGTYQVVVSNSGGETRSSVVTLSVDTVSTTGSGFSIYASENSFPARLFRVNSASGATSAISPLTFAPGLDFRRNGVLYGSSSTLSIISTTTGVATAIGALPELVVSIAFSPSDELYGVSNGGRTLYKLDPSTGRSLGGVPISGTTFPSGSAFLNEINGIDFAPDGKLYGVGFGLYLINPNTGTATRITPSGRSICGELLEDLDFGPDGQLRAATASLNGVLSKLYTIDPITGLGQYVGSMGATISGVATLLDVPTPSLPSVRTQPESVVVSYRQLATFTAAATGLPPFTYQWSKNGIAIPGATSATLSLNNVQSLDGGNYYVTISNSAGSVVSTTATLTVVPAARLANLSIGATLAAGQTLTVGLYVDGGSREILLRAGGPALGALGFQGFMVDPRMELFQGSTPVFANDTWDLGLATIFSGVGAYGFPAGSKDAAFVRGLSGSYSVQIKGTGPGLVIVEAYDTGTGFTPRLTNLSALYRSGLGAEALSAGFNITGTGTKRLLIRGVGPTLGRAPYLTDPKIEVFVAGSSSKFAENDNWDPALASTFTSVGAFALTPGSKDAALIATLTPGTYSVRVTGADGGTGDALIEVYELP